MALALIRVPLEEAGELRSSDFQSDRERSSESRPRPATARGSVSAVDLRILGLYLLSNSTAAPNSPTDRLPDDQRHGGVSHAQLTIP